MACVANFIRFPAVQNFENRLRFDKVRDSLKVGRFLRHSVKVSTYKSAKIHDSIVFVPHDLDL